MAFEAISDDAHRRSVALLAAGCRATFPATEVSQEGLVLRVDDLRLDGAHRLGKDGPGTTLAAIGANSSQVVIKEPGKATLGLVSAYAGGLRSNWEEFE